MRTHTPACPPARPHARPHARTAAQVVADLDVLRAAVEQLLTALQTSDAASHELVQAVDTLDAVQPDHAAPRGRPPPTPSRSKSAVAKATTEAAGDSFALTSTREALHSAQGRVKVLTTQLAEQKTLVQVCAACACVNAMGVCLRVCHAGDVCDACMRA